MRRWAEVELRPFYELEDFAPGPAIDAAKELVKKLAGRRRRTRGSARRR